jgi:DNA adenine methylase
MKSPVIWMGGKSRLAPRLEYLLPKHNTYVEVFGGGASLLFQKRPSAVEVYNDLDEGLVNFFRVLQNSRKAASLRRKLEVTLYSRAEFMRFSRTNDRRLGDVERAYRWFCIMRMSFGSQFGRSWGRSIHGSSHGTASCVTRMHTAIELIEKASIRFRNVLIECQHWKSVCEAFDSKNTLFFVDPPYVPSTRIKGCYDHDLTTEDHETLLKFLKQCKSKVILCGYDNSLYQIELRNGWQRISWPFRCCLNNTRGSAGIQQNRIENIWINYPLSARKIYDEYLS